MPRRPSARSRPFRRPSPWRISPILVFAPLAALTAIWVTQGAPTGNAVPFPRPAAAPDREVARFSLCSGPIRTDCVVDGDTFWYRGEKIRLADVNAPEVGTPGCAAEAALGDRATRRLTELLNAGPFTLEAAGDADRDRYGRLLRTATRHGESLGDTLRAEGLAERWKGYRGSWC